MMDVDLAPPGPARVIEFYNALGLGFFIISGYWTTLTSAWLLYNFHEAAEDKAQFKIYVVSWSFVALPIAAVVVARLGWFYAGFVGTIWLLPLLQAAVSLSPDVPIGKPIYSRAIAMMNFDKYDEAESAVIEELEKAEDDFDGWLLLAELYAVHFRDLAGAERTIADTCAQPAVNDSQRSVAWHKLADWRLKIGNDPAGARRALEQICLSMPGTHMAHMARLRINKLPATREEWIEQQKGIRIRLPSLSRQLDEPPTDTPPAKPSDAAILRAKLLVERLQKSPNEVAPREELARLLAETLHKTDAGIEQLELLLTISGQPPEHRRMARPPRRTATLRFKRATRIHPAASSSEPHRPPIPAKRRSLRRPAPPQPHGPRSQTPRRPRRRRPRQPGTGKNLLATPTRAIK